MSDERFEVEIDCGYDESLIRDIMTGELLSIIDCCLRLNNYEKENEQLQQEKEKLIAKIDFLERVIDEL